MNRDDLFRWIETPRDGRVPLWRDIPAGSFVMGREGRHEGDERSPREVTITRPFRISAVPVTHAQYAAFDPRYERRIQEGVSPEELELHPVICRSRDDAMAFCAWLGKSFSWARRARLPTEEEWEYACRAGTTTRYWSGDAEEDLDRVAWYRENSGDRSHRVGEKPANPWGLYDVHGNVWEWTLSPWTSPYYEQAGNIELDPAMFPGVAARDYMVRGGGYVSNWLMTSASYRDPEVTSFEHRYLGFRVLLPPDPAAPTSRAAL